MTTISSKIRSGLTRFIPLLVCILLHSNTFVSGQHYGMQFHAHEFSLDQRSGLNLTPESAIDFKGKIELQFQLRLDPDHISYFGYVFRMIIGNSNIDLIHSIFPQEPNRFELILGDRTSKIVFHIPLEELMSEWLNIRFEFDFRNSRVNCYFKDTVMVDELSGFDDKAGMRLMFGAHSFGNKSSTDVPSMILRDIVLKCSNKETYRWPLNETEGTLAHSVPAGKEGIALNPEWVLKNHNTWERILALKKASKVRTTFDPGNDDLYILTSDTLFIFNVKSRSMTGIAQAIPPPIESAGQIIFDTLSNMLIGYSVDKNYYSYFNRDSGQWKPHHINNKALTKYWHHNAFITPDGSLIAFGGYGYHTYKNTLHVWNPGMDRFDTIAYKGEFHPRYLAGSGYNPNDSLYYIIGGYGSESGIQAESPDYYYELISFSLEDTAFTLVSEFQDIQKGFCFANSVIFDDSNNMYALYFDKYQFNNKLQLIRVPLENPEIIELGNGIDYSFLDVRSHADLHFSKGSNSLVAVSSYSSESSTSLSVHTIEFPPQKYISEVKPPRESKTKIAVFFGIAFLLITVSLLFYFLRKKYGTSKTISPVLPRKSVRETRGNSIILFGGFQVIDQEGKDITAQFTPLPKKLFLFILLYSLRNNKGVSSNTMYDTFWFGKSVESARNNRAVNIAKLKSLLDNLESASISKETGYWKFNFDPARISIDYYDYLQIVRGADELNRDDITSLLSIVENSPFLNNTNADWLDPFKSEISNEIIDTFIKYIGNSEDDPEFYLHLTKCIFIFDPVSEEALKIQCKILSKMGKHSLAKKLYSNFISEYKQLYDEDYELTFNQVIEEK